VKNFLHGLITQITFVTPIFWFVELIQNYGYRVITGHWGWVYPDSSFVFFDFRSLGVWAISVGMMWTLFFFWFIPRSVSLTRACLIAGFICWAGEFTTGAIYNWVFGHPLYEWVNAPWRFIKLSALPLWCLDVLLYWFLTTRMARMRPGTWSAPP